MPNRKLIFLFAFSWNIIFYANAQNDKQVLGDAVFSPPEIEEGADVVFLIRFQNNGLDTAYNIAVRDTLDPRFDAGSFRMVDASHPYELLQDHGYIRWYFNGIRLPSSCCSEDEGNSSGFVVFSVQPHRFLDPGQSIHNRACINFDEDPPVCTNYATIWIDEGARAEEPDITPAAFTIVPNPNYGHFEVRSDGGKKESAETVEWWISHLTGKTIWDGSSMDLASTATEVMLERPAPGLYMLWMKEGGRLQVEQFAVIR